MLDRRESDVVLAAQRGNRNAFGNLVEKYQNLVTSIAFSKTGDLQRSEDIAQQAFLVAWEKRLELRDPDRFAGWLRSITRNLTLNSNRKAKRIDRSAKSLENQHEPVTVDNPAVSVSTLEQQELLWASLENIPEEYREPLVLFYREDKSVRQVAKQMELSVDAVKQRLSRGRGMLKREVEQFVEDLLGASKPGASFSAAVMAALPAASATVGKAIAQGGAAMGAKTMFGKLGFLASGPLLGAMGGVLGASVGVAGAWYGTKAAEKYATSAEEKELLWWFFKIVLGITLVFTATSIAAAFLIPEGIYQFGFVIASTLVYIAILTGLIVRFLGRQKELHRRYGKPNYPSDIGAGNPASSSEFRHSLVASTIGCWSWLIVLAAVKLNWIVLTVSIIVMLGHLVWRIAGAETLTSLPSQLRYQAANVITNMFLSGTLVIAAGFFGLTYEPLPNWGLALFVFVVGWLTAAGIWYAASKAEAKIANTK